MTKSNLNGQLAAGAYLFIPNDTSKKNNSYSIGASWWLYFKLYILLLLLMYLVSMLCFLTANKFLESLSSSLWLLRKSKIPLTSFNTSDIDHHNYTVIQSYSKYMQLTTINGRHTSFNPNTTSHCWRHCSWRE